MAVFAWSSIIIFCVDDFVILFGFMEHFWTENDLAIDNDDTNMIESQKMFIFADF